MGPKGWGLPSSVTRFLPRQPASSHPLPRGFLPSVRTWGEGYFRRGFILIASYVSVYHPETGCVHQWWSPGCHSGSLFLSSSRQRRRISSRRVTSGTSQSCSCSSSIQPLSPSGAAASATPILPFCLRLPAFPLLFCQSTNARPGTSQLRYGLWGGAQCQCIFRLRPGDCSDVPAPYVPIF